MAGFKRNLLLGLAAGAAGTAAMDGYWALLSKIKPGVASTGEEPSTVKLARRILRQAGVKHPSRQVRAIGGKSVHWGYGTGWGVAAGVARSAGVPLDIAYGQLLGAGLWALGDVWMLYQLGLAKHPSEYPARVHASSLGAHLAYGLGVWAAMESLSKLQGEERERLRRAA